ncbi:MAG: glycosyl hydrolase [Simkaniaceae bacterium]
MRSSISFFLLGVLHLFADISDDYMPSIAFGRKTSPNLYVLPENRTNPDQIPQTNNLQIYQTKAITLGGYSPTNVTTSPLSRSSFLLGPYFGNVGLNGPGIVFPGSAKISFINSRKDQSGGAITLNQYGRGAASAGSIQATDNFQGYNIPTLSQSNASINLVYSANEAISSGFDEDRLTTTLDPYGQSLQMTYYLPKASPDDADKYITDYVVMGNLFHDVYYKDLTPVFFTDGPKPDIPNGEITVTVETAAGVSSTVTSGPPFEVTGSKFIFELFNAGQDYPLVIYLEPDGSTKDYTFTVGGSNIFFSAKTSYTGWIRAAFLPFDEEPLIIDDSIAPSGGPSIVPEGGIYQCIQDTSNTQTQIMLNQYWFTNPVVQAIAAQPLTYFTLFPYLWSNEFIAQFLLQMNPGTTYTGPSVFPTCPTCIPVPTPNGAQADFGWLGQFQGTFSLQVSGQALALVLPLITMDDGTYSFLTSNQTLFSIANRCLFDLTTNANAWGGVVPKAPSSLGDSSESLFTLIFNMGITHALSRGAVASGLGVKTIQNFQNELCRPIYEGIDGTGTNVLNILDQYRSAIPTAIRNVSITSNEMTLEYDVASLASPIGPNTTDPLITFPGWFNVEGGVVNLKYNSQSKGNLFCAPAISGTLKFLENDWESWMEDGDFLPPAATFSDLFGSDSEADTIDNYLGTILSDSYLPWQPIIDSGTPSVPWPASNASGAAIQPLFGTISGFSDGYGTGKLLYQLAMTVQTISIYSELKGESTATILTRTEPLITYVKRYLYDFIVNRLNQQNYFVLDGSNSGVCFNGQADPTMNPATSALPYVSNIGMDVQNAGQAVDFGNAFYNDHILQYGYYAQALAIVINWDIIHTTTVSDRFIRTEILGADGNLYLMRHFADMIWRDTINPYLDDTIDEDFPFLRGFYLWEGHGSAGGVQFISPTTLTGSIATANDAVEGDSALNFGVFMTTGRNLESVAESYNMLTGVMRYAVAVLADNTDSSYLSVNQISLYTELKDVMLFLSKITTSTARSLWYRIGKGYRTSPTDPDIASFYPPFYKNYSLTIGNVFDTNTNDTVAFTALPQISGAPATSYPSPCPDAPIPPPITPPPIVPCPDVFHPIIPTP